MSLPADETPQAPPTKPSGKFGINIVKAEGVPDSTVQFTLRTLVYLIFGVISLGSIILYNYYIVKTDIKVLEGRVMQISEDEKSAELEFFLNVYNDSCQKIEHYRNVLQQIKIEKKCE